MQMLTKKIRAIFSATCPVPEPAPPHELQQPVEPSFVCPNCSEGLYHVKIPCAADYKLIQCAKCGVELAWPIPSDEALTAFYTGRNSFTDIGDCDAARYLADPSQIAGWAGSLKSSLTALGIRQDARIVELGCMHGMLSIELRRLGYDAWGVDLSPDGIKFLTDHGGQGYCGSLFDEACPVKDFDVFLSFHVFEHLPNPYQALREIHKMMPSGGVLHFVVPHWGGLAAQMTQERWKWFTYPAHLHYFSKHSFLKVIESIGFMVKQCQATSFAQEVDELLDFLNIESSDRTPEAKTVLATMLRDQALGQALIVTAVKA